MTNFKIKLNLKKYPVSDLSSIINAPVLKEGKVIGIITNYYIDADEATGCIYDDIIPNFDINTQDIISMELKEVTYNAK